MRKTFLLDARIPRSIREILLAILLEGDKAWYLIELAECVERTPSTLQRPLEFLVSSGILRRWTEGNRVYLAANRNCPLLPELRELLEKTTGISDVFYIMLQPLAKRIHIAVIYPSVTRGKENSHNEIDLLIVGDISAEDLARPLERIKSWLRHPVSITLFSPREFQSKVSNQNHFLRSVLDKDKIFVVEDHDELEHIIKSWSLGLCVTAKKKSMTCVRS